MEPVKIFSTRPDRLISKSMPVDRFLTGPVDLFFLRKVFVHFSMHLTKNVSKGGGMGEVLQFVTPDWSLRKKAQKIFAFFAKITQF